MNEIEKKEFVRKAILGLRPDHLERRKVNLKYSGKFKSYNGNIRYTREEITITISKDFEEVSEDIQMGIIQVLLSKMYKIKEKTIEMDLYNSFIKHLSTYAKRTESDPELKEIYERLNDEYFNGMLAPSNIVYGNFNLRKLGSYEYAKDLITISEALRDKGEILDYVIYHEMLHKKHKYKEKNGRSHHHTPEFRRDEKMFKVKDIEKKLTRFVNMKRLKKAFFG